MSTEFDIESAREVIVSNRDVIRVLSEKLSTAIQALENVRDASNGSAYTRGIAEVALNRIDEGATSPPFKVVLRELQELCRP